MLFIREYKHPEELNAEFQNEICYASQECIAECLEHGTDKIFLGQPWEDLTITYVIGA